LRSLRDRRVCTDESSLSHQLYVLLLSGKAGESRRRDSSKEKGNRNRSRDARAARSTAEPAADELVSEISSLTAELTSKRRASILKEKDDEIAVLAANVRALADTKKLLKRTLKSLRTELEKMVSENHDLYHQLESQKNANAALVTENGHLRSDSEGLTRQLVALRDKLKDSLQSDTSARSHLHGHSSSTMDNDHASDYPVNQAASSARANAKVNEDEGDESTSAKSFHLSFSCRTTQPSAGRPPKQPQKPTSPDLSATCEHTDKPTPNIFEGSTFNPRGKDALAWERNFACLETFVKKKGRFPSRTETFAGVNLGNWVSNQRFQYQQLKKGNKAAYITYERVKRLDAIGFDWGETRESIAAKWMENFARLQQYKVKHGNCRLPTNFTVDGINLCEWAYTQKKEYGKLRKGTPSAITQERIDQLNGIGFEWSWS